MRLLQKMRAVALALDDAKAGELVQETATALAIRPVIERLYRIDAILSSHLMDVVPDGQDWDDHPCDQARTIVHEVLELLHVDLHPDLRRQVDAHPQP